MAYRDMNKTVFGDLDAKPVLVIRVHTESSVYFLVFHEERGRKYVIVRGEPGSDREHVVIRDSDPRIGEQSLFDVPHTEWIGRVLEVAMMKTSPITAVHRLGDPEPPELASARVRVSPPPGMSETPRIYPMHGQGTRPGMTAASPSTEAAKQVVIGEAVPYPERHVRHAENCAALLRSIIRRDRLFEDVDREQAGRLHRALVDCAVMLGQIRSREK